MSEGRKLQKTMKQHFPICVLGKMLGKKISGSWANQFRKDSIKIEQASVLQDFSKPTIQRKLWNLSNRSVTGISRACLLTEYLSQPSRTAELYRIVWEILTQWLHPHSSEPRAMVLPWLSSNMGHMGNPHFPRSLISGHTLCGEDRHHHGSMNGSQVGPLAGPAIPVDFHYFQGMRDSVERNQGWDLDLGLLLEQAECPGHHPLGEICEKAEKPEAALKYQQGLANEKRTWAFSSWLWYVSHRSIPWQWRWPALAPGLTYCPSYWTVQTSQNIFLGLHRKVSLYVRWGCLSSSDRSSQPTARPSSGGSHSAAVSEQTSQHTPKGLGLQNPFLSSLAPLGT